MRPGLCKTKRDTYLFESNQLYDMRDTFIAVGDNNILPAERKGESLFKISDTHLFVYQICKKT